MNAGQARELVNRMLAWWPSPMWPVDTIDEFAVHLEQFHFATAITACERLRDTRKSRPTIAHVQESYEAVRREVARAVESATSSSQDSESQAPTQLDAWRLTPQSRKVGREGVAAARNALDRAAGGEQ